MKRGQAYASTARSTFHPTGLKNYDMSVKSSWDTAEHGRGTSMIEAIPTSTHLGSHRSLTPGQLHEMIDSLFLRRSVGRHGGVILVPRAGCGVDERR